MVRFRDVRGVKTQAGQIKQGSPGTVSKSTVSYVYIRLGAIYPPPPLTTTTQHKEGLLFKNQLFPHLLFIQYLFPLLEKH